MKFLVLSSTNPHYNLAVEEYLFLTSQEEVFLLWQNSPTVVIGKNQNANVEINREVLDSCGVKIARRITGGGAVYHDLGNLNYSFITPNATTSGIDFEYFTRPIIKALSKMGVEVRLSGRNDLETVDGLKISGSAQHRIKDRVLHHGTLLFSSDLSFMGKVLTPDREKLKSKAVKSVKKRVCNVKELCSITSVKEFISSLKTFIISEFNPTLMAEPKNADIDALYARNSSYEWLFPQKTMLSNYQKTASKRYDFGRVEISLEFDNEVIKKAKITGDFFGEEDISKLESFIENSTVDKLSEIDVSKYILGMTASELIDLIKN